MEHLVTLPILREIVVQLIGFILAFWVLKIFAWKPLLKLLDERKRRIAQGFQEIETTKKDVEILKANYAVQLQKIEEEARRRIQEALNEGRELARGIESKAREEARQILEKAQANVQLEIEKAQIELRNRIADLAIEAAEQILKEEVDAAKHKEIMLEFLEGREPKP